MGFDNPVHLAIAAVIILLVLGPKRLPSAARAAGRGIREFKESLTGPRDEIREALAPDASADDATVAADQPGQAAREASAASTSSSPETRSKVDPEIAG